MNDDTTKTMEKVETPQIRKRGVYKEDEFNAFIATLSDGSVEHWSQIAETIGVDKDTIQAWRKLPEAKEAINRGIDKALKQMEKHGGRDWKMWREKLKMLGLIEVERTEVTGAGGSPIQIKAVNYGDYNPVQLPTETVSTTPSESA